MVHHRHPFRKLQKEWRGPLKEKSESRRKPLTLDSLTQRKNVQILSEEQPVIQATISIKLDKDTPKEYWDRVLALLGERKSVDLNVTTESESQKQDDVEEQSES